MWIPEPACFKPQSSQDCLDCALRRWTDTPPLASSPSSLGASSPAPEELSPAKVQDKATHPHPVTTMRLNSSVVPQDAPFSRLQSGLEAMLLALGLGNGSGNTSESVLAAPNSDLDVNTDIYSKVLVTAVYLALFVVGTVGNSVTAFTLARKKSLQSLQSTVHYHLGSLALSDLLILLLAMPVELYNFIWVHHPWAFGDAGCRGYYFLRDACTYATALNVASLSVERYMAICHPFKAKTLMSRSRTKKFISAIWLASGLLAVPMLFTMGLQNRSADGQHPGGLVCTPIVDTATVKVVIQVRVSKWGVCYVTLESTHQGSHCSHLTVSFHWSHTGTFSNVTSGARVSQGATRGVLPCGRNSASTALSSPLSQSRPQ